MRDGFSSIVLVDTRGWVLLQERDEFPVIDPEKWGFVGGGLDDGEDFEVGAYRELAEETGLGSTAASSCSRRSRSSTSTAAASTSSALFVMRTDLTDDDLECHEGRQIVFVDPELVPDLDLTAAARIALPVFLASPTYAAMASGSS